MYQDVEYTAIKMALWSPMPSGTHLESLDGTRGIDIVAVREMDRNFPWGRRHAEYLTARGDIYESVDRHGEQTDFILVVGD
jgi:hypothetical protein